MQISVFDRSPQLCFRPKDSWVFLSSYQFRRTLHEHGSASFPKQGAKLHRFVPQSYKAINKIMFLHLRMCDLIDNILFYMTFKQNHQKDMETF